MKDELMQVLVKRQLKDRKKRKNSSPHLVKVAVYYNAFRNLLYYLTTYFLAIEYNKSDLF